MKKLLNKKIIVLSTLLVLSSCAVEQPRYASTGNYHVSVTSGGEKVENFNHSLVHRVGISQASLERLESDFKKKQKSSVVRKDLAGNIIGLSIAMDSWFLRSLGLRKLDIVTAINKDKATEAKVMDVLFSSLRSESSATMTIIRDASPHKMLYFIQSSSPESVAGGE